MHASILPCSFSPSVSATLHTISPSVDIYGTPFNPYIHYTNSLYWAVATMTSTGYGELTPTTTLEMCKHDAVTLCLHWHSC